MTAGGKPPTVYRMAADARLVFLWPMIGHRVRVIHSPLRTRQLDKVYDGTLLIVARMADGTTNGVLVVTRDDTPLPLAMSLATVRHVELLPQGPPPQQRCTATTATRGVCDTPLHVTGTCPLAADHFGEQVVPLALDTIT